MLISLLEIMFSLSILHVSQLLPAFKSYTVAVWRHLDPQQELKILQSTDFCLLSSSFILERMQLKAFIVFALTLLFWALCFAPL